MAKMNLAGASALALGVALAGGSHVALANGTVSVNIADYNAAQVAQAGGTLTVGLGQPLATYTVASGSLEINSRFTVTLPAGFTFFSQPSIANNSGPASLSLLTGGIGSQTATFQVMGGAVPLNAHLTTGQFSVQGATALVTPIPAPAALPITMQAVNNSLISNNDALPISRGAFASEPGIAVFVSSNFNDIDLGSPSLGTKFGGNPDTLTIPLIDFSTERETTANEFASPFNVAVLSPNGSSNTLATTDTVTVTIAGMFNGITTAFAATDDSCTSVVASGSATATQITIPGVPVGSKPLAICITADGQTLLRTNVSVTGNVAPGSSTDFLAASFSVDADFGPGTGLITYSGGGVISVTNFFTGDDSGYSSLLRVNNAGTSPATLYALVQPDTGGPALTGLIGTLAGGAGTVYTEAQVQANVPGLNLANSGQRSALQLIVAGPQKNVANVVSHQRAPAMRAARVAASNHHVASDVHQPKARINFGNDTFVSASGLLVNPGGAVTEMPNPPDVQTIPKP